MSEDFNRINELFNTNKKPGQSYIHEVIERTDEELAAFDNWKTLNLHDNLIAELHKQLMDSTSNLIQNTISISGDSTKGFVFGYDDSLCSKQEFKFLFDLLKERIQGIGYINKLADRRIDSLDQGVQMKERYYFKPKFSFDESAMKGDQAYGNLTLELFFLDEFPKQLKFHCNIYVDRNYFPAKPYEELLKKLLHPSGL